MKIRVRTAVVLGLVLLCLAGIPVSLVFYQAHRTGRNWLEILGGRGSHPRRVSVDILPAGEPSGFFRPEPIGNPFTNPPKIANLQVVDLDQDGLLDVVVCDCEANAVSWIRQAPEGVFTERLCADGLVAPAHVEAIDFDQDGDLDLLVAVLGMLFPSNDKIGSVVVLENDGQARFARHVLIQRVARVSDVRAGDLDGEGDLDLAVAQFGYDDGQTRWMENLGGWRFRSHILQSLSGPIHAPIADVDGDGHLDIAVLVSQEWEEIYVFRGDGKGSFRPHRVYRSDNPDFGSSGMWLADLDQDADVDIIYTNGDAFDYLPPHPWPWHGVQWLENQGDLRFSCHRVADFGGAVGARPADVDADGDQDLVVCSAFNTWEDPRSQSLIWLENDGQLRFRRHDITNTPSHIQALDVGDFDGDGRVDLVTGGMHVYPPYDRLERVVLWHNEAGGPGDP